MAGSSMNNYNLDAHHKLAVIFLGGALFIVEIFPSSTKCAFHIFSVDGVAAAALHIEYDCWGGNCNKFVPYGRMANVCIIIITSN